MHGGAVCFVAGGFVAGFVLRGGGLVAFAFSGLGFFGGALLGAFGLRFLAGDFAGFFYAAAVENLLGGGLGVAVGKVFLLAAAFFGFAEFGFFRLPIVGFAVGGFGFGFARLGVARGFGFGAVAQHRVVHHVGRAAGGFGFFGFVFVCIGLFINQCGFGFFARFEGARTWGGGDEGFVVFQCGRGAGVVGWLGGAGGHVAGQQHFGLAACGGGLLSAGGGGFEIALFVVV